MLIKKHNFHSRSYAYLMRIAGNYIKCYLVVQGNPVDQLSIFLDLKQYYIIMWFYDVCVVSYYSLWERDTQCLLYIKTRQNNSMSINYTIDFI